MIAVFAIRMAPWPPPEEFVEKIPGAKGASDTSVEGPATPWLDTVTEARLCPQASQGIWKFICPGVAAKMNPFLPVTCTAAVLGSAPVRLSPNTDAMLPGATAACGLKLAPFTVPWSYGCGEA